MSALKSGLANGSGAHLRRHRSFAPGGFGFVLPRWLRKPARFAGRLTSGDVEAPRFSAVVLSAALIGSFSLYGAILGGHISPLVQAVTARTGFAIDEIRVSGNQQTSEIDIFDRVGLDGWTSLVGFDPEAARERIVSLPWVEAAAVRKVYPSTLEVKVVERVPFAIWQQGSRLSLIEESGAVISPMSGSRHSQLPLVVGLGAGEHAARFLAEVAAYPELAAQVRGYIRVSDRRWDLRLENGVTVRLPERGSGAALRDLLALDKTYGLLSRDIEAVDMRFADRLAIKLSPGASEAREETMRARLGRNYRPAERQT